ncbi:hypothetical protein [Vibrio scophthalmi]|uniref:Uncharacterized protein n=1 Tax=Vibrio scophthalmi TaxID=45658 RepID=A0A1E3WGI6_9VIBR|nr:hypothetical protein [Vibrio scophthalmi]ODS04924.1 hypothetical protein VSF3289_04064 [Vibrio scophthalmi]
MTISSHFVYVPENDITEQTQPAFQQPQISTICEAEAHRQALVTQAQQRGGLVD